MSGLDQNTPRPTEIKLHQKSRELEIAFVNGKIDLAQAEAVQTLIGAKNQYALEAAEKQLQGAFSVTVLEAGGELGVRRQDVGHRDRVRL